MRNPARITIVLDKILKIWMRHPDLRLGQLIVNVISADYIYEIEDDKLLELLDIYDSI